MISIIIPVYNVEKYVRKCLDSVVNQTYKDLEILVIDDGSTDGSGKICDEYKKDNKVRVFHTENRGLSAARNLGLDKAKGEWIGFVDSDDWIEPYMYEVLLKRAEKTGADIVAFKFYQEYVNKTEESVGSTVPFTVEGDDILKAILLERRFTEDVWNKFYRSTLFQSIRYPEGRIFEDYATTYKLLQKAKKLIYIPDCLTHYRNRINSLSNIHSMKSLVDYWKTYHERFEILSPLSSDYYRTTLSGAVNAVSRMWRWYAGCSKEEKEEGKPILDEMQQFMKEHRNEILSGSYSKHVKSTCYYSKTQNPIILNLLYLANNIYRKNNRNKYFSE